MNNCLDGRWFLLGRNLVLVCRSVFDLLAGENRDEAEIAGRRRTQRDLGRRNGLARASDAIEELPLVVGRVLQVQLVGADSAE